MEERITSRRNPLLAHTKKLLTSRSYREKMGEFAADGVKLLAEAARWYPGLTTGITSSLGTASQIMLIVLMFFGRLGIMTISVGFMAANRAEERVSYAETKIMIG